MNLKLLRAGVAGLLLSLSAAAVAQDTAATSSPTVDPAPTTIVAPASPIVLDDIPPPSPDRAQIVFLKPADMGGDAVGVFAIVDGKREFRGGLEAQSRLAVDVAPGKHRFMAYYMQHAHFLDADVRAGQRYFVLVRYRYGKGYQMLAIRPRMTGALDVEGPTFKGWIAGTAVREPEKNQARWFKERRPMIERAHVKGQKLWDRKNVAERGQLALYPGDAL